MSDSSNDSPPQIVSPALDAGTTIGGHGFAFSTYSLVNSAIAHTDVDVVMPKEEVEAPLSPTTPEEKGWKIVKKIQRGDKDIKFVFLTIGSRGDVQPFIALCKRLISMGYKTPKIATFPEFEKWIRSHGIEFAPVAGDPAKIMGTLSGGKEAIMSTKLKDVRAWIDDLMDSSYKASLDADVFCATHSSMCGPHIAEAIDVPFFYIFTMPWTKTREFPQPFMVPNREMGPTYNLASFTSVEEGLNLGLWTQFNRFRRRIGLPTEIVPVPYFDNLKIPTIYCFSEALIPHPKDWPEFIHESGFFFLDNPDLNWKPPSGLEDFIAKGGPRSAVYVGFGSIVVPDPVAMTKTVIAACKKSKVNVILSKGWSSRGEKSSEPEYDWPENIYRLDSVPHDWLFPQLAGVVHHGGAGTVAAGLRAGCPTCVKPFFGDQFFWGGRVESMGAGMVLRDLTEDGLAQALIRLTTDETMKTKAQEVGERIRSEDGPGDAIQFIIKHADLAQSSTDKLQRTLRDELNDGVSNTTNAIREALTKAKNAALANENSIMAKTMILGQQTVTAGWESLRSATPGKLTKATTFIYDTASAVQEEAAKKIQQAWRWWKSK